MPPEGGTTGSGAGSGEGSIVVKITYAHRRSAFYSFDDHRGPGNELPPPDVRAAWLAAVHARGFEGVEVGVHPVGTADEAVRDLGKELADAGVPAAVIRGGGGFASPRTAGASRERVERAIHQAALIGCNLVNMTVSTPAHDPLGPGATGTGERISQGGSRYASEDDFAVTARHLQSLGTLAADLGVSIAIEMHQHSIADNSWSTLHLLDLVDLPNVGCNPDLGNLYWCYEEPEETIERCIVALAPRAKYWHCKQLVRVHVPEVQHAYYLKVPMPDGDMDYRFAIAAMLDAGYPGALAIEGVREGDQLYRDGRSVAYAREVIRELGH